MPVRLIDRRQVLVGEVSVAAAKRSRTASTAASRLESFVHLADQLQVLQREPDREAGWVLMLLHLI